MTKITLLPTIAGALLACGLSAAPAHAMANRTFVSGKGTDSGTCAYAAPCRSFAFAITQTNAKGEIDVLDPAGYGAVTINRSISIVNDGVGTAGIKASSGNGVTINAGAGDSIHLRGLTIEGLGSGATGIQFNTGGNLEIENCVIQDFKFAGISITPTAASAVVTGVLSNVITNNNGDGIFVGIPPPPPGSVNVTIVDSVASNNSGSGIHADGPFSGALAVMVRNSVASYNGAGLRTMANAVIRVAHSVVTGNGTGVLAEDNSTIFSYGDNDIDGNADNNTGALKPLAMH
ncbi:MAG: right-handed parallel beta-helix repeat-containing protein [Methylocella sp.]